MNLISPLSPVLVRETFEASVLDDEVQAGRLQGRSQKIDLPTTEKEMLWHGHLINYLALGMSQREAARMCECTELTVGRLLRTPWFVEKIKIRIAESGGDALAEMFKGAAIDAIVTLTEICNDKKAPASARVASAKEIIDRNLGKAAQTIEVKTQSSADPVEEAAALEREIMAGRNNLGLAG